MLADMWDDAMRSRSLQADDSDMGSAVTTSGLSHSAVLSEIVELILLASMADSVPGVDPIELSSSACDEAYTMLSLNRSECSSTVITPAITLIALRIDERELASGLTLALSSSGEDGAVSTTVSVPAALAALLNAYTTTSAIPGQGDIQVVSWGVAPHPDPSSNNSVFGTSSVVDPVSLGTVVVSSETSANVTGYGPTSLVDITVVPARDTSSIAVSGLEDEGIDIIFPIDTDRGHVCNATPINTSLTHDRNIVPVDGRVAHFADIAPIDRLHHIHCKDLPLPKDY
jgi:hypothetical protein